MRILRPYASILPMLFAATLAACSTAYTKGSAMGQAASGEVAPHRVPATPNPGHIARNANPEDPDVAIARRLDAALVRNRLHVRYTVNNHVVTLTGVVSSPSKRARAGKVALAVINVQQVVNELRIGRHEIRLSNE